MSNVFTYPSNAEHSYITLDDALNLGIHSRAITYLNSDTTKAYGAAYKGSRTPFDGLTNGWPSGRTPENALNYISKFRAYYGVASGYGLAGYPTYDAIYNMSAIECYFHLIQFNVTNAYPNGTTGTLTLECQRSTTSHSTTFEIPSFTTTNTHGMGDATTKYSDSYSLYFGMYSFDTGVAGEWGNYLNYADNGGTYFYFKVIDAQKVEVYTDSAYTTPVNIGPSGLNWSAYTSGGGASIREVGGTTNGLYQLLYVNTIDQGNKTYTRYDADYYSGYGNSVNDDFGANIVGARPSYYVVPTNSSSTFTTNKPIDHATYTDYQFDSAFNPDLTIVCSGDGAPYTGSGANGCITGATLNVELGGLMNNGSDSVTPYSIYGRTLVLPATYDSDSAPSYAFNVSNITNANPAVVTFAASTPDQSSDGLTYSNKVFTGIVGMNSSTTGSLGIVNDLNGRTVYLKQINHTQAELYSDKDLTAGIDTSTWAAYSSGGHLQDFDDNIFESVTTFGGDYSGRDVSGEYQNFAPLAVGFENVLAGAQYWPTVVSPAKMNVTVIHPTRKSYGQDLTRYTNSTGAYGYRLSLTYNNISKANWRVFDSFVKQMRGAGAPFLFYYGAADDGNGYQLFTTNQQTINVWNIDSAPRLAKATAPGDTLVYFTGFQPGLAPGAYNGQICKDSDTFFGFHGYRSNYTLNNVGFAAGDFETNQFGEAIIRFTSPIKNTLSVLSETIAPTNSFTYAQCQLVDDEVDYDWHPTGNFVSFKVDMDLV